LKKFPRIIKKNTTAINSNLCRKLILKVYPNVISVLYTSSLGAFSKDFSHFRRVANGWDQFSAISGQLSIFRGIVCKYWGNFTTQKMMTEKKDGCKINTSLRY